MTLSFTFKATYIEIVLYWERWLSCKIRICSYSRHEFTCTTISDYCFCCFNWFWINVDVFLSPWSLTEWCFWKLSSDHSGHKRSSSWGRTYSFTSAVNRGCVLEDEDKNVKAGAQAALQVCCVERLQGCKSHVTYTTHSSTVILGILDFMLISKLEHFGRILG